MRYRKFWIGLALLILSLEAAYVVAFKTQMFLPFFDLDGESNLPTWVSSTIFSLAGALAIGNYMLKNKEKTFWLVLGLCCLFISLDEIAQIHEYLSVVTNIKWVYFYSPIGVVTIAYLYSSAKKNWQENPRLKIIMIGVALGFVMAVGLETLSHLGLASLWQKIEYMLEEGAEMLGAGMILIGCLQEIMAILQYTERSR